MLGGDRKGSRRKALTGSLDPRSWWNIRIGGWEENKNCESLNSLSGWKSAAGRSA